MLNGEVVRTQVFTDCLTVSVIAALFGGTGGLGRPFWPIDAYGVGKAYT